MVIWKNLIKNMVIVQVGNTTVSIYDKETGEYKEVMLKDLYNSIESVSNDKVQKDN